MQLYIVTYDIPCDKLRRKAYYSHQVPAPYYDMDEAQYEEELAKFTDYYKELI